MYVFPGLLKHFSKLKNVAPIYITNTAMSECLFSPEEEKKKKNTVYIFNLIIW